MTAAFPRIAIVGCGYVGLRLANQLRASDLILRVASARGIARVTAAGFMAERLDLDVSGPPPDLPLTDGLKGALVYYCVPPPAAGDRDPRLERFLARVHRPPAVLVYLGTTGVYGDRAGGVVDETTPPAPRTPRARRRLAAEHTAVHWCAARNVRCVILRVPGIYGPGRLPVARLAAGEALLREEDSGPGNRIHVEDLAGACLLVAARSDARGVYNVTDGDSLSATGFTLAVAAATGLPRPPQVTLDEARRTFPETRLSFLEESRLVSSQRLREQLGFRPRHAEARSGIAASLAEEQGGEGSSCQGPG